jgi:hypothetical protein
MGAGIAAIGGSAVYAVKSPQAAPYLAARMAAGAFQLERSMLGRALQTTRFAQQDRLLTSLEGLLGDTVEVADLAMKALDKRTSRWARAEFRRAMSTKVRARKMLRAVRELKARGGISLGPKGFQIR